VSGTEQAACVRIEPDGGPIALRLGDIWASRELVYFLAWRDLKVRYRQTVLGGAWAIVQPLSTMLVFAVVFGHLGRMPSDHLPYPLFVYAGLLPWQLFAYALTDTSRSLIANERLLTKIYFPRLVIPVAALAVGLVDFAVAGSVLLLMMGWYGIGPGLAVLTLPLFVALAILAALGGAVWLSALNVRYRDVRHTVAFLAQLWLFVTPVAYPSSLIPAGWRTLYGLNPMVGVVEGFRWSLVGAGPFPTTLVAISIVVTAVVLISGLRYFRRVELTFADML